MPGVKTNIIYWPLHISTLICRATAGSRRGLIRNCN
jgi:hypothetical protein